MIADENGAKSFPSCPALQEEKAMDWRMGPPLLDGFESILIRIWLIDYPIFTIHPVSISVKSIPDLDWYPGLGTRFMSSGWIPRNEREEGKFRKTS